MDTVLYVMLGTLGVVVLVGIVVFLSVPILWGIAELLELSTKFWNEIFYKEK